MWPGFYFPQSKETKMNIKKTFLMLTTALVLSAPAHAQDVVMDDSPIVLSGIATSISDSEFTLNYGQNNANTITVEMDDWDWFAGREQYINTGDRVVVSGEIDDDFLEGREIEADEIYLVDSSNYFSRNAEESSPLYYSYMVYTPTQTRNQNAQQQNNNFSAMDDGSRISMTGTVKNMDGQEFTIDTGDTDIQVDMASMGERRTNIDMGDRVNVSGHIDDGFFDNREISADNIVVLSHNNQ